MENQGSITSVSDAASSTHGKKLKEKHEQLSKHLSEILKSSKDQLSPAVQSAAYHPFVLKAIKKLKKAKGVDDLCSNDLKALNKRFMSGHLPRSKPVTQESVDESDDEDEEESSEPVYVAKDSSRIAKILAYQLQVFVSTKDFILKYASKHGNSWLKSIVPTNQIFTLITFLMYTYILNVEFLLYFLPLLFFSISFIVMVVSTLQSLRGEKRFKEFVAWSELLVAVNTALDVEQARDNYFRNHVSPLISFPPALVLNVLSITITATELIPSSELALLSILLCATCFYSYFSTFSKDSFYVFGLHFFASLLEGFKRLSSGYEVSKWSLLVLSYNEIEFHLSLSIVLRISAFSLLLSIPFQTRHKCLRVGFFRGLVPMLYVLVWWEMFSLFFLGSSLYGMLRAGIGTIILFCSIPATFLFIIFAVLKWLTTLQVLKAAGLTILIVFPLIYYKFLDHQKSVISQLKHLKSCFGPSLKIVLIIFCFGGLVAMAAFYRPAGLHIHESSLTWQDYNEICSADHTSSVESKRLCFQLNGHHINWTGTVEDIAISSIENKFESLLLYLPSSLANWMSCLYGERYLSDESFCKESEYNMRLCLLGEKSQRECHLDRYNKYGFVITMTHADPNYPSFELKAKHAESKDRRFSKVQIKVVVGNRLRKLVFLLKKGMDVSYKGLLLPNSGEVLADKLVVLDKTFKHLPRRDVEVSFRLAMDDSVKGLVRFFFSPFVTFAESD